MITAKEQIPPVHKEISIKHSITNIVRSAVLMKRAVNTLTFANNSLEGTDMTAMIEDINNSKRSLADAMRSLEKYGEEE